jgi:hypothetical protein
MAAKRGPKGPLTDTHKAAMAQGRNEGRAVRAYLEALRANKPKRGRKRTGDSIKKRLAAIDEALPSADALSELRLIQERRDLADELASIGETVDINSTELAFVDVAKSYSERQGITYDSWREVGVPASVLTKAGISRRD